MKTVDYQIDDVRSGWSLTECRPRHLADFVESIWHFEGVVPYARERHLPNGLLDLVVQFGSRFEFVKDGVTELCPVACLAGLQTGSTLIEPSPHRACVLGVRLYPAGAYAIIGCPLHESTSRLVDLNDLVGRAANELVQRCATLRRAEDRVRCAVRWLSGRVACSRGLDPLVAWSAARIEQSHGNVAISLLRQQTGLSKKRLIQGFREQIGVRPKVYARIIRLRRALTLLHEGGRSPADVAVAAGYYDQPHMNLDFRELAGLAPSEFLGAARYSPTTLAG